MTDRELVDQLADALIRKALASGWLRVMLQDIVLRTMIAQKHCEMGTARAFLESCNDHGIKVKLDRQTGKLCHRQAAATGFTRHGERLPRRSEVVFGAAWRTDGGDFPRPGKEGA